MLSSIALGKIAKAAIEAEDFDVFRAIALAPVSLTHGSGGLGNRLDSAWISKRDGAVTAIERAWEAVDARDPTALHQCVDAMALAREVLLGDETSGVATAEISYAPSAHPARTVHRKA